MTAKIAEHLLRRHPLQRLESPSREASAFFHALGIASFAYSFNYLIQEESPANTSYGWHFQYLTIVGLTLSALTFILALIADLTLSRRLFRFKNYLSVASAPMECLITVLYWGLRSIDTKLVLPEWAPPMSLHTDFSFHLVPAVALIADLLLFSPPYTIAFLPAVTLSLGIAFSYWFWIERCYQFNQFYPYPIFELLTTPQRVGLFVASATLMSVATILLIWLYHVINGQKVDDTVIKASGNLNKVRSGNLKGR